MSQELCRLCLSPRDLIPIFNDIESSEDLFLNLSVITSLNIDENDGFPQTICVNCNETLETCIKFRNQSRISETKLYNLGFRKQKDNKKPPILDIKCTAEDLNESKKCNGSVLEENLYNADSFDIDELQNENVTADENGANQNNFILNELNEEAKVDSCIHPEKNQHTYKITPTRKQRREIYLSLVDGSLEPNGPVKCNKCGKTVKSWNCFIHHAKLHLGFQFTCEYCGKSFVSSTQLKRHCRSHHGMRRELECNHCGYLALDNAQLVLHERRAHTGERPYVCDTCAAAYHSRRCLLQHLESHLTTASVQCPLCSRRFKSRRHLARHRYSAHAPGAACPVCGRTYSKKYLRTHVAGHGADS